MGPLQNYVYVKKNGQLTSSCEGFYGRKVFDSGQLFKIPSAKTIIKVVKVATAIVAMGALLASCSFLITPLAVPVIAYIPISVKALTTSSGLFVGSVLIDLIIPKHIAFNFIQKDRAQEAKKVSGAAASLVTHDGVESFHWKKELIQAAKSNIALSGNYCGGEAFDEILKLIKSKYKENPSLTVTILSSSKFLTDSNKKTIEELQNQYSEYFSFVPTDDIWTINPGMKKVTNHTKALSIDNGAYFMTGGSGIENKYAYLRGVGDRSANEQESTNGDWLANLVLPRGFRDMDFVFKSRTPAEGCISSGNHFHTEVLSLAKLWNDYNKRCSTDSQENIQRNKSVYEALCHQLQDDSLEQAEITGFDSNESVSQDVEMRVYSTGPEMEKSAFSAAILKRIKSATRDIYIDHMYYHPTQEMEQALVDAANRGVKIHILTNDNQNFSPAGHKLFGRRNRYNCHRLFQQIASENRENLSVHFYGQKYPNTPRNTSIHKKMIIIDDYVIGGSSNFGYKSTVTMSDHEINFISKSKEMAKRAIDVFEEDAFATREAQNNKGELVLDKNGAALSMPLSRAANRKKDLSNTTLSDTACAALHRLYAPLIG